jgi:UDP-N-acetylmuramyl pentapeptide phosphotransferase/UDP-N-acetylglucosamine-1-phosphate transferase
VAVRAIPLAIAFLVALLAAPTLLRGLAEAGFVRSNYARREVPVPTGILIPLAAFVALGISAPLDRLVDDGVLVGAGLAGVMIYIIGVCLLGAIDDLLGTPVIEDGLGRKDPRGVRGHLKATFGGGFSTGAIKAVGSLGLAAFAMGLIVPGDIEYLLAIALVVVTTNLFNLLDLRPGRALKVFFVLAAGLCIGAWTLEPVWITGVFLGSLPVLLYFDLGERGMLGDTGSNAIGAIAGVWMVLTLSTTGQAIALAVVLLITLYGEFRSISQLIDRTPVLRFFDRLGRRQQGARIAESDT